MNPCNGCQSYIPGVCHQDCEKAKARREAYRKYQEAERKEREATEFVYAVRRHRYA